jgi:hypothetical protein
MWWTNLSKAFEQFRRWSAVKTLLEFAGAWKWIALGASVAIGWLLPWFSRIDPAWRVVAVLFSVALSLAIALFVAALRKVSRPEPAATVLDQQQTTEAPSRSKPKKYQVAIAAALVILAIIGAIFGPKKRSGDSISSIPPVVTGHPPEQEREAPTKSEPPDSPTRPNLETVMPTKGSGPSPPSVTNNAPGGIANSGTINGPATVNNFAKPDRTLDDETIGNVAKHLETTTARVYITTTNPTPEMTSWAFIMFRILYAAHWTNMSPGTTYTGGVEPLKGVHVYANAESNPAALLLQSELLAVGVKVYVHADQELKENNLKMEVGSPE